jgi:branched-chain amino acid transport system substrate-binding protein
LSKFHVCRSSTSRSRVRSLAGLAVILSLLAVGGAACGDDDDGGSGGGSGTITLALVTPLSAPGDYESGQLVQKTAEMWVKQVNDAGGIDGRTVKLKVYDDQGKPEVGSSAVGRAISQDGASAIVGVWHSAVTLAEMEVVKRYNVPMIAFYSWTDEITGKNYDQVFRIGPYNKRIGQSFAPFIEEMGYKTVTVLAEDTPTGVGMGEALKDEAEDFSVDIVPFQAQAQDVTPELAKIASQDPDMLLINSVYPARNLAINQAKEVGVKAPIVTGWDWPVLDDYWKTVKENGVGVTYPVFFDESLKLTDTGTKFKEDYNRAEGADPVVFQYYLVDSLNAVKEAVTNADTSDPAKLVEELPNVNFEGTFGPIEFERKPGTTEFNQAAGLQVFFKQMTEVGESGDDAKLVFNASIN